MRAFVAFLLVTAVVFSPITASAQQWSPVEEEIWKAFEDWHDLMVKEGIDAGLDILHEKFMFWSSTQGAPKDKTAFTALMQFWTDRHPRVYSEVTRVAMRVVDKVAVGHYYLTAVHKTSEDQYGDYHGHWTVTFVKEKDRWLVLCLSGGPSETK